MLVLNCEMTKLEGISTRERGDFSKPLPNPKSTLHWPNSLHSPLHYIYESGPCFIFWLFLLFLVSLYFCAFFLPILCCDWSFVSVILYSFGPFSVQSLTILTLHHASLSLDPL